MNKYLLYSFVAVCFLLWGCKDNEKHTPEASSSVTAINTPATPADYVNSYGMAFMRIPAGTFVMGGEPQPDNKGWNDLTRQHQVTLSKDFLMGRYEVTQAQWQAVMGENPSHFKDPNKPVENVSWLDIQVFIEKLNSQSADGVNYRLPTEAEWEYAARAGHAGWLYISGNDAQALSDYAWYREGNDGTTHPVGLKEPNAWGLYDMFGNVAEWVYDYDGLYSQDAATDPVIGKTKMCELRSQRVGHEGDCRHGYRGGSYMADGPYRLIANRLFGQADMGLYFIGFRLAADINKQ